jgi:kynurenine 3-monooxygenase
LASKSKITVVGAGLAGSLLAIYLAKCGFEVNVYEKRADLRKDSSADAVGGGRSINLALSTRGIHALKEVGVYDEIKKIAIPMYGRMVHPLNGKPNLQPYGKDMSEHINAVSRAELNTVLMNFAEKNPGVKFHFDTICSGFDFITGEVFFRNENTAQELKVSSDAVIACDGVASAIRMEMLKLPRFDFSQNYEDYGYKELTIPAGPGSQFLIEKNALHIWPRGSYMLIALPNSDGSFTCTLFFSYDGAPSFASLDSADVVFDFFKEQFHDVIPLMPSLTEEFFSNPVGHLITIKCYPWSYEDKAALLGDACHAIVPFFGQGMNAAFEDCAYLNEFIGKYGTDWKKVFKEYQESRKANTDAIAELAKENFIEMRDLIAQPRYQLKKKIEAELFKKYPHRFIPKYSMVTFHRIPYSTAFKRGKEQEQILNKLSDGVTSIKEVNWQLAEQLIKDLTEVI